VPGPLARLQDLQLLTELSPQVTLRGNPTSVREAVADLDLGEARRGGRVAQLPWDPPPAYRTNTKLQRLEADASKKLATSDAATKALEDAAASAIAEQAAAAAALEATAAAAAATAGADDESEDEDGGGGVPEPEPVY